jgi:hypothetical protein
MSVNKLSHLMIDLETMGKGSNSAIVSIGAVEFELQSGETGEEFYTRVDLQSCLDLGLKVNASTIFWWLMQSEKARKEICKEGKPLREALFDLSVFIKLLKTDVQTWGNGARFDLGILEDAYDACGSHTTPWGFRFERDVRTLVSFAPAIKDHYPFTGVEHNPIDDCKYQIGYCSAIWNKLNTK